MIRAERRVVGRQRTSGFGQKPTFDNHTRIVDNPDRMPMLDNFQRTGAVSEPWLVCRNPAPQNLLMSTGW
jgi:hypothetical protein